MDKDKIDTIMINGFVYVAIVLFLIYIVMKDIL